MAPKITIVTRTRNRSLFLKRVLVSVAAQDFGDYLHIVVNDGGDRDQVSDCIRTLPEESRSKVVQLDNPISLGREGAVNPGFEHALQVRSEYTVVLDDDDTWAPTFLSTLTGILDANLSVVAVACGSEVVYEESMEETVEEVFREPFARDVTQVSLSTLLLKNYVPTHTLLFRTEVLQKLRGWRTDVPVLADWDFNLRLALMGPIAYVREPLAFWHHRTSTDKDLGNSIVVAADEHREYENLIRDDYLRQEADEGAGADIDVALLGLPLLVGGLTSHIERLVEEKYQATRSHLDSINVALQHETDQRITERTSALTEHIESVSLANAQHLELIQANILSRVDEKFNALMEDRQRPRARDLARRIAGRLRRRTSN